MQQRNRRVSLSEEQKQTEKERERKVEKEDIRDFCCKGERNP